MELIILLVRLDELHFGAGYVASKSIIMLINFAIFVGAVARFVSSLPRMIDTVLDRQFSMFAFTDVELFHKTVSNDIGLFCYVFELSFFYNGLFLSINNE